MDVLEHLTQEHRKAEQLIADLASTEPGAEREQLIDQLSDALSKHMAVEEQFLYPLVLDVEGEETQTEAEVEHSLARQGLDRLRQLRSEPGFGAVLDMVEAGIAHHVKEEEEEIFPKLRERAGDRIAALDPDRLEAEVDTEATVDLTKDELYRQAQDADIPGRSSMTKQQLADAVAEAR